MGYKTNLCIIFMPDAGPRRSYRVRQSRFRLLLLLCACLPVVCALLGWQCWRLWQQNAQLRENVLRFESDYQAAQATAERLENLEALLQEENLPGREQVLRRLNALEGDEAPPAEAAPPEPAPRAEGPGHEDFPAVDTGYVAVSNVQARALRGGKLRIALDLRNTDSQKIAVGMVSAVLLTADGKRRPLDVTPESAASFRISRFKRSVMVVGAGRTSMVNAQVLLEVRSQDGAVVFRNIFPVER
ncbi:hypothetical protein [Desulfovibrio legallii]|uniref:Uncharacterized protein n=1 Tax=Desulfovibrio legallii TaxID=571438 RepID=A0A1G7IR81_9BACT|nr:hypothetical protein [Desulfovibrio legallii]SDF15115.1 hypothetical protein SAMN05192586_10238 [Desulfovibrio legallii]